MIKINMLRRIVWECRACKVSKPLSEFMEHNRVNLNSMANVHSLSRERICRPCATAINVKKRRSVRERVVEGYGSVCNCPGCGQTEIAFLCLDHVIPCGTKGRKNGCEATWRDALRRNFPDDYQLLCYNCNCAKAFNIGGCPHLKEVHHHLCHSGSLASISVMEQSLAGNC